MTSKQVVLRINGRDYPVTVRGQETLLEVLRDQLGLTGTKTGCEESECGLCTVTINGRAVLSCISLAGALEGEEITTIEGLADQDDLHPLQQAFLDKGAVQCGFCIPGFIMSAKALLDDNPAPSREDIDYALDGNLCRCAGYLKIIEAIEEAARRMPCAKTKTLEQQPACRKTNT